MRPNLLGFLPWAALCTLLFGAWKSPDATAHEPEGKPGSSNAQLWIYRDVPSNDAPETRSETERMFAPFGLMPAEQATQISVNPSRPVDRDDPSLGTCIEYYCEFKRGTDWVGAYTLVGGNSWGQKPGVNVPRVMGVPLEAKLALRFVARGEGVVSFKMGGVTDGPHGSSLRFAREADGGFTRLTAEFREYTIGPVEARTLTNLIDPFCMVTSALGNRGRDHVRVEVDNIRIEFYDRPTQATSMLPADWQERLRQTCFVSYTPTGFDPTSQRVRAPQPSEIEADLRAIAKLLADAGIPKNRAGIITYGCSDGLEQIAPLARDSGLLVILGIFNPNDDVEVSNAAALLARDDVGSTIAAVCVGNEAVTFRRCTMADIQRVVDRLRRVRRVPMTTTEIVQAYGDKRLYEFDFAFVNAHAIFANVNDPARAATWAISRMRDLLEAAPKDYLILIKEIGWPAGPAPAFTGEQQTTYWKAVLQDPVAQGVGICIFDGLNNVPWKREFVNASDGSQVNVGPHWPVLFDQDRTPKPSAIEILQLWKRTRNR